MTNLSPATQPGVRRRPWRFLPRISLLAFLLLTSLICVSVSHYRLMQEKTELKKSNDDYRREIGYLVVDDRTKIYVRQLDTYEDLTWKFRIYLPPDKQYSFAARSRKGGGSSTGLQPLQPEFTLTVAIRRQQSGNWYLNWTTDRQAGSFSPEKELPEKLMENHDFVRMRGEQKEFVSDKPVDLIGNANSDLRVWITPAGELMSMFK